MTELLKVFVYGTLKPGEANYDRYCHPWVIEAKPAIVYGRLYHLPLGYPALTSGNSPVQGFLLWFKDPTILADLDELEDYQADRPLEMNEYFRIQTEIFEVEPHRQSLGTAWVYQMQPALIEQLGGVWVPSGQWTSQTPNF